MALTVVVERHVQLRACRPAGVADAVECTRRQLAAAQVGDQLRAVVAVEACAAVVGGVEPDPRAPSRRLTGADGFGGRLGLVAPVKPAQLRKLIRHNGTLEPAGSLRVDEGEITTACPVDARDFAQ